MNVLEYLQAKTASLLLAGLGIALTCLIAAVCGCPHDAVVIMTGILVLCTACACAIDYLRTNRFYRELRSLATELEHPYQLHSLVGEPTSPEQVIVFDALRAMGVAAAAEVNLANARTDEHREFVEGWVHSVKAPLASCSLIANRIAEPERSQLDLELDKVIHKVDRALWYARSDCATRDYAIREVSLADIARTTCRDNARFLIEQGCIPEVDIDDGLVVFTDRKQAVFIVSQLVENAAKYGAHRLRFCAEQSQSAGGAGHIALHVVDDGLGIPKTDIDRVFERGFTGERGHEGTASTGMGLYLAARLCEQLGLGLSISSAEWEGTCATLSFPLDRHHLDVLSETEDKKPLSGRRTLPRSASNVTKL